MFLVDVKKHSKAEPGCRSWWLKFESKLTISWTPLDTFRLYPPKTLSKKNVVEVWKKSLKMQRVFRWRNWNELAVLTYLSLKSQLFCWIRFRTLLLPALCSAFSYGTLSREWFGREKCAPRPYLLSRTITGVVGKPSWFYTLSFW